VKEFWKRKPSVIDEAFAKILTEMNTYGVETKEYQAAFDNLERLTKMKAEERRFKVSPDTIAIVAGNLAIALIVVGFERGHVMTTKVMGHVLKPNS
jgi:hypothetical protein